MFQTDNSPPIPEIAGLADVSLPNDSHSKLRFNDSSTRRTDMHKAGAAWFEQLATDPDSSHTETLLDRWLTVASSLLDHSAKNTVLLSLQDPTARFATEYETWNETHDADISARATARYLWSAIEEPMCPVCENGPRRHQRSDCQYTETPPEQWDVDIVGFSPTPVFTHAQTATSSLPVQRRLWDTVDSQAAATQLRDTLIEHHTYYEVTPVGVSATALSRDAGRTPAQTADGTDVLNLASGGGETGVASTASSSSQTATSHHTTAYLSTAPNTDPYQYQAAITIPTANSPAEAAVSASVRQLAMAVLTGQAAPHGLHPHDRPGGLSDVATDARLCEAELVAHLIARRTGIEPPRGVYALPLRNWYGESYADICTRLDRVLAVAKELVRPADRRILATTAGAEQTSPPDPITSDALRTE